MGFSSQAGHVILRTQAVAGTFQADITTLGVAMKTKTGALAPSRTLMVPDPEIGGGRDVTDAFLGPVSYAGDYEFYTRLNGVMTLLQAALGTHVVGPAGTQDVQTLGYTGTATSGTFTLTYGAQTTAAIPFNATAGQIQTALAALSNIGDNDIACTGGPLFQGAATVVCTFDGSLNGTTTAITATSTSLVGSSPIVTVTHTTTGLSNAAGFQHLFVPFDGQLNFLSIEEQISGGPVFDVWQYTDAVVNTLHFECAAAGYLLGTAGMIARVQNAVVSPITNPALYDNSDLMVGTNITITYNGVSLAAKSFKFDLDNQFAADDFRLGSFILGDLTAKRRNITVGVTIREQDKTLWRQAVYGSSAATSPGGVVSKSPIVITISTYSNIPGSSPLLANTFKLVFPLAALEPYALKVSGDDIIDSDIVFQPLRPVTTTPIMKAYVTIATGGNPA